jgi:DNA-binding transcriptional regulator YiaG
VPRHERRLIEPYNRSLTPSEVAHNFRVLHHFTQQDAAEWWGCNVRTWRRWEEAGKSPPRAVLKRVREWARRSCPWHLRYLS